MELLSCFECDGSICIKMGACDFSLCRLIACAELSPVDVASNIVEIAAAVRYIHSIGVVHGDLKPGNVLCKGRRRVLCDFGHAFNDTEPPTCVVGTPFYSSPECLMGRVQVKSDLWSLGVVIYEMIMGTRPFFANTLLELTSLLNDEEYRPPMPKAAIVPDRLNQCVVGLLQRVPGRRTSLSDVIADANDCLNHRVMVAMRTQVSAHCLP